MVASLPRTAPEFVACGLPPLPDLARRSCRPAVGDSAIQHDRIARRRPEEEPILLVVRQGFDFLWRRDVVLFAREHAATPRVQIVRVRKRGEFGETVAEVTLDVVCAVERFSTTVKDQQTGARETNSRATASGSVGIETAL